MLDQDCCQNTMIQGCKVSVFKINFENVPVVKFLNKLFLISLEVLKSKINEKFIGNKFFLHTEPNNLF